MRETTIRQPYTIDQLHCLSIKSYKPCGKQLKDDEVASRQVAIDSTTNSTSPTSATSRPPLEEQWTPPARVRGLARGPSPLVLNAVGENRRYALDLRQLYAFINTHHSAIKPKHHESVPTVNDVGLQSNAPIQRAQGMLLTSHGPIHYLTNPSVLHHQALAIKSIYGRIW
jgi:hypothetical protein